MSTQSQQCRQWPNDVENRGALLLVPAICYYEALREIERRKATAQIERLKAFTFHPPDRFVTLVTEHLESAAKLWANARNSGSPTASSSSLDGDVILAAQVLNLNLPKSDYIVASTNPGHISRYVPCDHWMNIQP